MPDAWPAELPQKLLREGNSFGLGDGQIETQPDQGPPQSRPRFTSVVEPLAGVMNMSAAQWAILKTFFRITLGMGAMPFIFPDQMINGETVLVKFPKGAQPNGSETGPDTYRIAINLVILP